MTAIAEATKWKPVKSCETAHYHFPKADFEKKFSVPSISDSIKDKLVADGAASAPKGVFTDNGRLYAQD